MIEEHWNPIKLPYLFYLLDGNLQKLTIEGIYQALIAGETSIIQRY